MIDTRNGGQTCAQCKHYIKEGIRQDRFFGPMKVMDYCQKRQRLIATIEEGEDCPAFLKRIFSNG